ncbi:MAG TPA: AAC(3) family N-acetyltransferase [Candidatus Hydrogenedentes bacterium]|nr:AAC(3) family N-acetyltransferase [Candidatus Hydrogenedentota bacterium]HQM50749.1 AAC(3) family N-acetyltransferase [Candidatus Hydrogenedentota bacterium]
MAGNRVTRSDITAGFRELGIHLGDAILVHSSLSSFGHVEGGADAVIDGILDALGPEGTLLVPTLTGGPELSPENPPHIDLRTAPCWVGRIPETARQRSEAVRSVHPTHSCAAIGSRAAELTRGHYLSPTPCGVTSPYFRLAAAGGSIVMIGCGLSRCTTCHTVEELANVDYHLQRRVAYGWCIDQTGARIETPCLLHSYDGPERDFPVLEPGLLEKGLMRKGTIGNAEIRVIDAMGLIETALDRLRFDPYYLTRKFRGHNT